MISDDSYNRKTGCFAFRAGSLPRVVEEEEREERIPHWRGLRALSLAPPATPATLRTTSPLIHLPSHFTSPFFLIHLKKQLATDHIIHSSIQQSSVLKKKKILWVVKLLPAKLSNTLSLVSYPFCPKQFSYGLHLSSIRLSSVYIICCQWLWLVSEKEEFFMCVPTICVWLKYVPCFSSIFFPQSLAPDHILHPSTIHASIFLSTIAFGWCQKRKKFFVPNI